MNQPSQSSRSALIDAVQQKYASRIKARLAAPRIDVTVARDGMLDCYVATYFGGLKQGIAGTLGINASEEQVIQVARSLFRRRLREHGASFEAPSVEALDRVKREVDRELHFEELPGELRGLHDQVCTLMIGKAEGGLEHRGDRSAIHASSGRRRDSVAAAKSPPASHETRADAETGSLDDTSTQIQGGLRSALAAFLEETAAVVRQGESVAELRARLGKLDRLVAVLDDFG